MDTLYGRPPVNPRRVEEVRAPTPFKETVSKILILQSPQWLTSTLAPTGDRRSWNSSTISIRSSSISTSTSTFSVAFSTLDAATRTTTTFVTATATLGTTLSTSVSNIQTFQTLSNPTTSFPNTSTASRPSSASSLVSSSPVAGVSGSLFVAITSVCGSIVISAVLISIWCAYRKKNIRLRHDIPQEQAATLTKSGLSSSRSSSSMFCAAPIYDLSTEPSHNTYELEVIRRKTALSLVQGQNLVPPRENASFLFGEYIISFLTKTPNKPQINKLYFAFVVLLYFTSMNPGWPRFCKNAGGKTLV
ncbi:hypothetical protein GLAREA_10681 [Glarea lozoyensis ATCC 20868]|uniref:Uncharacterized protein n=1 Tax=Glarea lozoyensis (strain ATCC 20868 / MF5171) TaxID=1116229 RepID=S3DSN9_GLAL2|nr:uncharacterized protein GLAREA_10681 [Glarea lozoyensis ATCC 20868]EPE34986.1 hypothetical protein GLAREA_10681 [Glarea lozoyensis ATCC 20868]